MLTLALIGLVGGLITGVSPCVLPMLPIIFLTGGSSDTPSAAESQETADERKPELVGATDAGAGTSPGARTEVVVFGRRRRPRRRGRDLHPLKIIAGIVVSFSVFTLLGSTILSYLGLPDDFLLTAGIVILALVGLGFIVPQLGHLIERPFYRLPKINNADSGPFLLGLGLGTLYVPCAGPVLAAITVAGATGEIGLKTVVLTVAFAIGAALPLLVFASAGANIRKRVNAYRARARAFRVVGGVVLIALAVALSFNLTDAIQKAVPNYTGGLEEKIAKSDTFQGALAPSATDENKDLDKCTPGSAELAECGAAPPLRGTQQWFNTDGRPLTLEGLQGKVVLLDFFAYSCINCQRDQPYIEKWYENYQDDGLEVIGIHSPEFAFEKSASNLEDALSAEGTTYPVVQDNDLDTWTAYRNRYWPAKYLIDATGTVRAIKFGEGGYEQTETLIRDLLRDADPTVDLPAPVTEVTDADIAEVTTPELKLAPNKPGYYGTPRYLSTAEPDYALRSEQPTDTFSLGGSWKAGLESITSGKDARIRLHFQGRNVYHVLSGSGTVTVSREGQPDTTVDVSGTPNLYPLVEGSEPLDETITLTYSPGITGFTFSFG